MPTYGIIYLIRDKTNGKVYIGRTTQALAMRWAGHVHDSKRNVVTGLLGAIKRNGVDAFTIEELGGHPDKGSLMLAERAAIERYRATDPNVGYNIMAGNKEGGDGYTGPGKRGQTLQTQVLRIRMTEELHTALTRCAVAQGLTLSEWARQLMEGALRRYQARVGSSTLPGSKGEAIPDSSSLTEGVATVMVAPEGATTPFVDPSSSLASSSPPSTDDEDLVSLLAGMDFNVDG